MVKAAAEVKKTGGGAAKNVRVISLRGELAEKATAAAARMGARPSAVVTACVRSMLESPRLHELVGREKGAGELSKLEAKKAKIEARIKELRGTP